MSGWLVEILKLLGIIAIVAVVAWFLLSQMTLPEPIRKILIIVLVVLAGIIGVVIILQMPGGGPGRLGWRSDMIAPISGVLITQQRSLGTAAL